MLPLLTLTAASGCLGPRRSDYVVSQSISIPQQSPEADRLWEAVQETLRRHRYRLDRVDRRAGVITTLPETSQSVFEFWRHDVDSRSDLAESTLNSIRRWAAVSVSPSDDGTWTELSVVVHKERLSSPDRQFNSTGAAYQYFGDSLPSTTGIVQLTAEHDRWLDLGRDPAMEARLLERIRRRAGLQKAVASDVRGDS